MTVKKTEERSQDGNIADRGYDTYKVINGLGLTLGLALLGAILTVMINMNKTITTERIIIGKHDTRLDNHDDQLDQFDGRLVKVEDKINDVKEAIYKNPFRRTE